MLWRLRIFEVAGSQHEAEFWTANPIFILLNKATVRQSLSAASAGTHTHTHTHKHIYTHNITPTIAESKLPILLDIFHHLGEGGVPNPRPCRRSPLASARQLVAWQHARLAARPSIVHCQDLLSLVTTKTSPYRLHFSSTTIS